MKIDPIQATDIVIERKQIENRLYLTAELKGDVSLQIDLNGFASSIEFETAVKDLERELREVFVRRIFGKVREDAKNALKYVGPCDHSFNLQQAERLRKAREAFEPLLKAGSDLV